MMKKVRIIISLIVSMIFAMAMFGCAIPDDMPPIEIKKSTENANPTKPVEPPTPKAPGNLRFTINANTTEVVVDWDDTTQSTSSTFKWDMRYTINGGSQRVVNIPHSKEVGPRTIDKLRSNDLLKVWVRGVETIVTPNAGSSNSGGPLETITTYKEGPDVTGSVKMAKPENLTGVGVKGTTATTITAKWNQASNAAHEYKIACYLDGKVVSGITIESTLDTREDGSVGTVESIISGLAQGQKYQIIIVAENAFGSSEASELTATTRAMGTPAPSVISTGLTSINIGWKAVDGATSYNLYWEESTATEKGERKDSFLASSGTHMLLDGNYDYKITELEPKQGYKIWVEAIHNTVNTETKTSGTRTATTKTLVAPVVGIIATDSTSIEIGWNAIEDASYNVYYSLDENKGDIKYTFNGITVPLEAYETYQIDSLTPDTTYYIWVEPQDSEIFSVQVSTKTTPFPLRTDIVLDKLTVLWDKIEGAAEYNVYLDGDLILGSRILQTNANTYSHEIKELTQETEYTIQVKATLETGDTIINSVVKTVETIKLKKPVFTISTTTPSSIDINWSAVAGMRYNLYWNDTNTEPTPGTVQQDTVSSSTSGGSTNFSIKGLTQNKKYSIWVEAIIYNDKGAIVDRALSDGISRTTPVLEKPKPVATTTTITTSTIDISWNQIVGATSYNLYWSETATSKGSVKGTVHANESVNRSFGEPKYQITGLKGGTKYYIWVEAEIVDTGMESLSEPIVVTTQRMPETGMTFEIVNNTVKMEWNVITGYDYNISYKNNRLSSVTIEVKNPAVTITGGKVSYTIDNLTRGEIYSVNVSAVTESASVPIFTDKQAIIKLAAMPTVTASPTSATGVNSGDDVVYIWAPVAGIDVSYEMAVALKTVAVSQLNYNAVTAMHSGNDIRFTYENITLLANTYSVWIRAVNKNSGTESAGKATDLIVLPPPDLIAPLITKINFKTRSTAAMNPDVERSLDRDRFTPTATGYTGEISLPATAVDGLTSSVEMQLLVSDAVGMVGYITSGAHVPSVYDGIWSKPDSGTWYTNGSDGAIPLTTVGYESTRGLGPNFSDSAGLYFSIKVKDAADNITLYTIKVTITS